MQNEQKKRKTFKTSNADDLTHTPEIPDASL
jgi:hypothetical protein